MSAAPANPSQAAALRFMQALWEGDQQRVDQLLTPAATWVFQMGMPQAREARGRVWPAREALARIVADLFGKFSDEGFAVTPTSLIGDGDVVVIEYQAEGTTRQGDAYFNTYVTVLELEDGRVRQIRPYNDTAHMLALLG
jgi:ketosteroid isomerase-like protein